MGAPFPRPRATETDNDNDEEDEDDKDDKDNKDNDNDKHKKFVWLREDQNSSLSPLETRKTQTKRRLCVGVVAFIHSFSQLILCFLTFLFRTFENDEESVRFGVHYFKQLRK